ncbi:hypothetical protein EBU94_02080 [bacterium]|nr:hypothetical protein [bacterium]
MEKNTKKWIWLSVGAVTLGVGGYFLFKFVKNKFFNEDDTDNSSEKNYNSSYNRNTNYNPTNSSGSTANPFKSKAEVLAFQQWVINTKGDKTILGGGGASGFGDDGAWGTNTASAWTKYGTDYKASPQGASSSANTWSSSDGSANSELKDRLEYDANQNVEEVSLLDGKNDFIWFPSGQASTGYVKVTFKDGGEMTIEKKKLNNFGISEAYATKNGNWKKTATGWEFSLEGKNYPSQYNGSFIVNALFSLLKDSGYYSWTDSSFIPFNGKENIKWQDL